MFDSTNYPVTHSDGTSNTLTVCTPEDISSEAPLLFIYPAMGVSARYYTPLLEAFAQQDLIAACADLRGLGHSSVRASRTSNFSYRHHVEIDLPEVLAELKSQFPNRKLFLFGHSLGGQMESLFLAANPDAADGLILTACCSVYYKGWLGTKRYTTLAGTQLCRVIANTLGYFPGEKLGFGGLEAKGVMRDWGHQAISGCYELAGSSVDYEALLSTQPNPVLAVSFVGDKLAPESAVQNLVNKFKAAKTEHWNLDGESIGVPTVNHFNWVKKPQQLAEKVVGWIQQQ